MDLLKEKRHFAMLDGLRGIAALAVVIFHFMEVIYTDYSKNFIGHGFLAVDFFFCLSGFVIGYAYDERMVKMGVWQFFKSRLIRLHPLVILGSVLGAFVFFIDPLDTHSVLYGGGRFFLIFLCSACLIPFPVMPDRGSNLFGLNAPAWSLFWEYVANFIYAFVLYKLARRYILICILIAAAALLYVVRTEGDLMGGWGGPNFWDGLPRVSFSFLTGLLLFRSQWIIRNKIGFIGLAFLLSIAFLLPYSKWNWIGEPVVIFLYFPLLIALGAGVHLSPGWQKIAIFSGRISYPLYMTHYSGIWIFAHYMTKYKPDTTHLVWVVSMSVLALVGMAYAVMKLYDGPVRSYLNAKRQLTAQKLPF